MSTITTQPQPLPPRAGTRCANSARLKSRRAGPQPSYCEQYIPEVTGDSTAVLIQHTALTAFQRRRQLAGSRTSTSRSRRPSAEPQRSATTRSPR